MINCILNDPEQVMIGVQDRGEPPSWVPRFAYRDAILVWLYRDEFNILVKRRYDKPCDICPKEVKKACLSLSEFALKGDDGK
jgi:hypothetical protein